MTQNKMSDPFRREGDVHYGIQYKRDYPARYCACGAEQINAWKRTLVIGWVTCPKCMETTGYKKKVAKDMAQRMMGRSRIYG